MHVFSYGLVFAYRLISFIAAAMYCQTLPSEPQDDSGKVQHHNAQQHENQEPLLPRLLQRIKLFA